VSGQKRVDVQELIDALNTISAATKFSPDYNPEVSISSDVSPEAVKITSLQQAINGFEEKFSGNCNCLVNNECNQTCQGYICQSTGNQSCQSAAQCSVVNCSQCSYACQSLANCTTCAQCVQCAGTH
jgi:hypothetical protein